MRVATPPATAVRATLRIRFGFFALLVLACAAGCKDSSGPHSPIEGAWTGLVLGAPITFSLSVDASGGVSGSGNATVNGTQRHLSVVGSFTAPSFSLTLTPTGIIPVNYAGVVDGSTLRGVLAGSGFNGDSLTMTR